MIYLFKHLFPNCKQTPSYSFIKVYGDIELNIRHIKDEPLILYYDYKWRYPLISTTKFNDASLYALRDLHKILEMNW